MYSAFRKPLSWCGLQNKMLSLAFILLTQLGALSVLTLMHFVVIWIVIIDIKMILCHLTLGIVFPADTPFDVLCFIYSFPHD